VKFLIGVALFYAASVVGGYMYGGSLAHPNVGGMFIGIGVAFANRVYGAVKDDL
jgi:hypothetical protein